MDFLINHNELTALSGLPYLQRLAYLMGIRPYMDVKTGVVGIKRGISYQSISEQLYIEPHQGIKSASCSRTQTRRAVAGLERAGLISLQSQELKLILKCQLATLGYFVQNKPDTKSSQQDLSFEDYQFLENKELFGNQAVKPGTDQSLKADTPLKEDNYIYLLSQFKKFWDLYPLKNSRQKAWEVFQYLNPTDELLTQINSSLHQQIQFQQQQQNHGQWVAAWKYPANWLAQRCWEDEIQIDTNQEKNNAIRETNYTKHRVKDSFWESCKSGIEAETYDNIIAISEYRRK